MEISASFFAVKENLEQSLQQLDKCNLSYIHVDVTDGKFVPTKTMPFTDFQALLKNTKTKLDIHLMVEDVKNYVDDWSSLNPNYITFHHELNQTDELINYIKTKGIKVGLSICPDTSIKSIIKYLDKIDLLLVMSVNPGYGGQKFIENTTNKINELVSYREKNNLNFKIEVDGGINNETIKKCNADIYVVGSYITSSTNYIERIKNLEK